MTGTSVLQIPMNAHLVQSSFDEDVVFITDSKRYYEIAFLHTHGKLF